MWLPHVLERKVVNFISCSVIGLTANCLLYIMHKGSWVCDLLKMSIVLGNRNLRAAKKQTRKLEIPCVQDTHPAASTIRRSTRCQNSLTEPISRMAMLRTSVQRASTRTLQTSWNSQSSQRQENHQDRSLIVNEICRWKHMFQFQSGVSNSCPGLFTC